MMMMTFESDGLLNLGNTHIFESSGGALEVKFKASVGEFKESPTDAKTKEDIKECLAEMLTPDGDGMVTAFSENKTIDQLHRKLAMRILTQIDSK